MALSPADVLLFFSLAATCLIRIVIQPTVALTIAYYLRVPVLNGSQPSGRLCRPITGQRKLDETDIVQVV